MNSFKKKAQKRIILGGISQLNDYFQPEFPSLKIAFSTFAFLRPKWYMSVAVPGHRMCVSALNTSNCQPISQIIMMYWTFVSALQKTQIACRIVVTIALNN